MAILKTSELPERDFSSDEKGILTTTRRWKILTDGIGTSPLDIFLAFAVKQYDSHPHYPEAIARTPKLSQTQADGVVWTMEVMYSSAPFESSQQPDAVEPQKPSKENNKQKPPELRPPVWSFSRKEMMRIVEKDIEDVPITNSAGFPYDPPIEVPSSNMLIRIDFVFPNLNINSFRTRWDRVNSSSWKGFPARTLRINDYNAKNQFDKVEGVGLQGYWNGSIELEHSEIPWNPKKVLDQGNVERFTENGIMKVIRCCDDVGNPINMPFDGRGKKLLAGQPLVFRDHKCYKEADFTSILF